MQLVILAAGMGSRFGGLKQMEPMADFNNFLLEYSVYDASPCSARGGSFNAYGNDSPASTRTYIGGSNLGNYVCGFRVTIY